MKITAGLGSVDDYLPYVEAGADEFFCGYVPYEWMKNGGLTYPLNRREVLYYNVQIGSESEMEILAALVRRKKKIVTVALNGLFYAPHQYPMIEALIKRLFSYGFFDIYCWRYGAACLFKKESDSSGRNSCKW